MIIKDWWCTAYKQNHKRMLSYHPTKMAFSWTQFALESVGNHHTAHKVSRDQISIDRAGISLIVFEYIFGRIFDVMPNKILSSCINE